MNKHILAGLMVLIPSVCFGAANISLPYYRDFESDPVGDILNDGYCNGLRTTVDDATWSDCEAYTRNDYPARYGDNYLANECQYDGNRDHRTRAMKNYIFFQGFREDPTDCHILQDNDGSEYWIGWSNYIPYDYAWEVFYHQFFVISTEVSNTHPETCCGSKTFSMTYGQELGDGTSDENRWSYKMRGNQEVGGSELGEEIYKGYFNYWREDKGKWTDYVVHFRLYEQSVADTSDAIFEVYKNGVLEWSRVGLYNTADGAKNQVRFHIYNWAFSNDLNPAENYMRFPDDPTFRATYIDEFRFHQQLGGKGDSEYCDVAPPIWADQPSIIYPLDTATDVLANLTLTYDGYTDHRTDDLQGCFSRSSTTVQIDEDGGDWSGLVFESTTAGDNSVSISGLSELASYQVRVKHISGRSTNSDTYDDGEWSETVSFTTGGVPTQSGRLVNPATGFTLVGTGSFPTTPPDCIPTGYGSVFQADTDVAVNSTVEAAEQYTVVGVDGSGCVAHISGTSGNVEYEMNNSSVWTSENNTFENGDVFAVRQASSSLESTETTAVLTLGSTPDTYSATTITPGVYDYGYLGTPNTDGVADAAAGTWVGYGSNNGTNNITRVYTRQILPTEHSGGIADSINIYIADDPASPVTELGCIYNGSTLIGRVDISGTSAESWTGYQTLIVEDGESLTFSTSDTLYIGYCLRDTDPTNSLYLYRDNGSTDSVFYSTIYWINDPISPISWSESSVNDGIGVMLKYELP